ncbi:MAG: lysophospholipid acyltransferase family protein [Vicinamibacterales bacterium]|nr:lysophospholipid acyltransferase family protein [Vicinamibacterales bacterium]
MNAPGWQESRGKRLQVALIVAVAYPLFVLLRWTLRWRVEGREYLDRIAADGHPPIVGFWHGRILAGMYFFRNQGIVVLTSQNFDGEWIARIITKFGYGTARGSSSRNSTSALREMIRHIRAGRGAAFTLDGPRGPARRAKSGAVWLASATGCPIVPFHVEADRAWTMKSWDGSQIPKPFSTVSLVLAEPVPVPRGLDADGIESYCRILEERIERAAARACALAGHGTP